MLEKLVALLRWSFGYLVFVIVATIAMIATFLPPEMLRYRVAILAARIVLWAMGARMKVVGEFPKDGAYILMPNHASFADPLIAIAIMKGKFAGIMAKKAFRYPIWRTVMLRYGVIPIRRRERASAMAAIDLAAQRLHSGYSIVIFPEGTRTIDGKMVPLKKGGFHMAVNTQAPILPLGIEGAFRLKAKTSWILRPGPITVRFGTPIQPSTYGQKDIKEIMEEVRQQLLVLSGEESSPDSDLPSA